MIIQANVTSSGVQGMNIRSCPAVVPLLLITPSGCVTVDDALSTRNAEADVSLPAGHRRMLGTRVLREMRAESSRPGLLAIPVVSFDWKP